MTAMILQEGDDDLELYPGSDGEPMGESTNHYRLIFTFKENLDILAQTLNGVFVAADLFGYPLPLTREQIEWGEAAPYQAPKVMRNSNSNWNGQSSEPKKSDNDRNDWLLFCKVRVLILVRWVNSLSIKHCCHEFSLHD